MDFSIETIKPNCFDRNRSFVDKYICGLNVFAE